MDDFERLLNEMMKNPDFKEEYETLEPEYAMIR